MRELIKWLSSLSGQAVARVAWVTLVLAEMIGTAASAAPYQVETLVEDLKNPYSLAFLPDGGLLISEKGGALRLVREGKLLADPIAQMPGIYPQHQGGFSDVVLHPDFADNRWVYFAYAMGSEAANGTGVMRGQLINDQLSDLEEIFRTEPDKDTGVHFGARLAFLADNSLLITVGDGGQYREQAQRLDSMLGSVVRLLDDGSVPADNPQLARQGALPQIWSYGHRNPQGIVVDPSSGQVYATEHGPQGGDELNRLVAGGNYGWPLATYGIDYSGASITPYTAYPGVVQPLLHWTPSLAPSGLAQCRSCQWPEWEGDLFAGQLKGRRVQRIKLVDGEVYAEESLFAEQGERIRDVRFGPDGALYLVTDNLHGRVLRVTPAKP